MRNIIRAAVLCAALPASAQPITEPRACQVTIARAPEDVRQVVEAWVHSEAQCSIALEVRIVPTEGGFYLLAQDESGRIRERIVPDAQTAGVLVASWIADDNAPAPAVPPPAPAPAIAPPERPAAIGPVESLSPPGLAPIAITKAAPTKRSKWLTAGALFPMSESSSLGIRVEADVARRGKWTFGAAGSLATNETMVGGYSSNGHMSLSDSKLMAYVARTWGSGKWQLRPSLGAGVVHTTGDLVMYGSGSYYTLTGTFASFEGAVALTRDFGKRWAAYVAPVGTIISQRYEVMTPTEVYPVDLQRSGLDLSLFSGVRYRL
jgi:hypothetical protein